VVDEKPELAAALRDRLETFKARMTKHEPTNEQAEITLDEELLGRLDRLGYVLEPAGASSVTRAPSP
jgi:hypothetical protein